MQEYIYIENVDQLDRDARIERELNQDHIEPNEAAFLHGYYQDDKEEM